MAIPRYLLSSIRYSQIQVRTLHSALCTYSPNFHFRNDRDMAPRLHGHWPGLLEEMITRVVQERPLLCLVFFWSDHEIIAIFIAFGGVWPGVGRRRRREWPGR
jgi:hypothetical protein